MSDEKEVLPRDESEVTDLEAQVIKQCEFYFGDSNLPRDKFLRNAVKEGKGWVSLASLATFNRLKTLMPGHETVESRAEALAKILRKSKELLAVSKDNFVKRTIPLDPDTREKSIARSLCVHGLPTDPAVTNINSVTKFFTDQGATVLYVKLQYIFQKKSPEKKKGSRPLNGTGVIELKDAAEMESFLGKELKWEGEAEALKVEKLADFNERIKEKREEREAAKESGKKRKESPDKAPSAKEVKQQIDKDRLIKLGGLAPAEGEEEDAGVSRESIKKFVEEHGKATVAFINFQRGEDGGIVRLANDSAVGAVEAAKNINEAKAELSGKVRTVEALSGEAEEEELKSILQEKQARRKKPQSKKGKGNRGPSGKASKKRQKTS